MGKYSVGIIQYFTCDHCVGHKGGGGRMTVRVGRMGAAMCKLRYDCLTGWAGM